MQIFYKFYGLILIFWFLSSLSLRGQGIDIDIQIDDAIVLSTFAKSKIEHTLETIIEASILEPNHSDQIDNLNGDVEVDILNQLDNLISRQDMSLTNPRTRVKTIIANHQIRIGLSASINRKSTEILFYFDYSNGRLVGLGEALPEHSLERLRLQLAYGQTVLGDVKSADLEQAVLNYLTDLKLAYMALDIAKIRAMYDRDAVIILGNKNSTIENRDGFTYYLRNLNQYLSKLNSIFKSSSNYYLDLEFESIKIQPFPDFNKNRSVGIQLFQRWKASNYEDEGWLYLLVKETPDKGFQITLRAFEAGLAADETPYFSNSKFY